MAGNDASSSSPASDESDALQNPLSPHASGALAPLTRDTPFKRAFASFRTLRHLLNAILRPDSKRHKIEKVLALEVKSSSLRSIVYDIHCQLKSGDVLIVELQKAEMRNMILDRLIGYQAREYSEQWLPGGATAAEGGGYALKPVRVLALLDFKLSLKEEECGSLVQHYHLQADRCVPARGVEERLRQLTDITIVQLPLAPKADELADADDAGKWAHLLRYSQKYRMESLPEPLTHGRYKRAAESARFDAMSVEERAELAAEERTLREWKSQDTQLRRAVEDLAGEREQKELAEAATAEERQRRKAERKRRREADRQAVAEREQREVAEAAAAAAEAAAEAEREQRQLAEAAAAAAEAKVVQLREQLVQATSGRKRPREVG
jgi:hypothetical protein